MSRRRAHTYTPYDTIKAHIRIERHKSGPVFVWTIRDKEGHKMAQGEEFTLQNAYKVAYQSITGLRLWLPVARGTLIPHEYNRTFRFEGY